MNELIKIESRELSGATAQTIDAREPHAFLEVKSEFRNWIKNRVDDFSFVQGVDFGAGKFLPGSDRVDCYLSLFARRFWRVKVLPRIGENLLVGVPASNTT